MLITDHKPLVSILSPDKGLPAVTAARLQRYALLLAEHSFQIRYRKTDHSNADDLSRLPLEVGQSDVEFEDSKECVVHQLEQLPITSATLKRDTARDPILAKVILFTQTGWPERCSDKLWEPYFDRCYELTVEQGCLVWGMRVVIPAKLQDRVLDELHGGHIGIVKMKALARCHIWWPGIDQEIERATKNCKGCTLTKQNPKLTPVHPWEYPEGPWKHVHIDFAGPMEGKHFMVVVDAFSKWPEVAIMQDTTTETMLDQLHAIFARWGIPLQMCSPAGVCMSYCYANCMQSL